MIERKRDNVKSERAIRERIKYVRLKGSKEFGKRCD